MSPLLLMSIVAPEFDVLLVAEFDGEVEDEVNVSAYESSLISLSYTIQPPANITNTARIPMMAFFINISVI